jgi:hypothetical protein
MRRLAVAAAVLAALAATAHPDDELSYWEVDRRVVDRLNDGADLTEWAETLAKSPKAAGTAERLERFLVFARAGHESRALAAIDDLRAAPPIPDAAAKDVADFLIERKDRVLAVALLERLPAAEPGHGLTLLVAWAHEAGWQSVDA